MLIEHSHDYNELQASQIQNTRNQKNEEKHILKKKKNDFVISRAQINDTRIRIEMK